MITRTHAHYDRFSSLLQVKSLYKLMKYDSMDVKKDSYLDSWDLRRLYSYSFRRQLDATKRAQVPRDWGLNKTIYTDPCFEFSGFNMIYIIF